MRGHSSWVPSVARHLNPVRIAAALKGRTMNTTELATRYSFPSVVDLSGNIQVDTFFPRHIGSGWIVGMKNNKRISKLPLSIPTATITATAASEAAIAMGTQSGQVVIMHFPPAIFRDEDPAAPVGFHMCH